MRNSLLLSAIFMLTVASCNTLEDMVQCDFDQQAMLTNYADNLIVPRFNDLQVGTALMDGAAQAFCAAPSTSMLVEAKISFGAAYEAYQKCSPFSFGPGLINGVSFRERFNTFPTNTASIEANISVGTDVSNSPKSTVGFPAVEYLLFGEPGMSESEIVALFTTAASASSRRAYLLQLTEEIRQSSQSIYSGWSNYRGSFIDNLGTAEGTSISLLVNELNFDFETLKNFKFKIPLGKYNGGIVIPSSVEAYYAGGSAMLALAQANGLRNIYLGIGENGSDDLGLYDYLVCLKTGEEEGQLLADAMTDQFTAIVDALANIPDPMSETLVINKPVVDEAYLQMQMLTPMMKSEMSSALGVQISYQDNDGD
jgi:hypothetical protein